MTTYSSNNLNNKQYITKLKYIIHHNSKSIKRTMYKESPINIESEKANILIK